VWGYRVNRFLKVGFVLGVLQFLVFLSGWDHLIEVGPFREHRFIELPAFYLLGRGFVMFFHGLEWNDRAALLGVLEVYLFNILVTPQGLDSSAILAELLCLSRTPCGKGTADSVTWLKQRVYSMIYNQPQLRLMAGPRHQSISGKREN